jgi:hypothetical protein
MKGAGTKGTSQPLTAEGAAALSALVSADGLGRFSRSAMWKSFRRACSKLGLSGISPYWLRHSFASEVFEKTGNIHTTQLMMRHKHVTTTLRYGKRAVSPVLAAAIENIRRAGGFGVKLQGVTGRETPSDSDSEQDRSRSDQSVLDVDRSQGKGLRASVVERPTGAGPQVGVRASEGTDSRRTPNRPPVSKPRVPKS